MEVPEGESEESGVGDEDCCGVVPDPRALVSRVTELVTIGEPVMDTKMGNNQGSTLPVNVW
jgi:hypothetical protein